MMPLIERLFYTPCAEGVAWAYDCGWNPLWIIACFFATLFVVAAVFAGLMVAIEEVRARRVRRQAWRDGLDDAKWRAGGVLQMGGSSDR